MDRKSVEGLLSNSKNRKIFIIGDVMLDKYMMGEVTRVSPEAPVQVFDIKKTEYKLGGAANVSHNVNSLGAYPFLIGVIGDDEEATMFKDVMGGFGQNTGGLIAESGRPTTAKTRVIADSHHLLRIDSESKEDISEETENKILESLESNKGDIDIIILQDYNKGVLTPSLIKKVMDFANMNEIKTLVDPKFFNFFEYENAFLFKPNRKEFEQAIGKKINGEDDLLRYSEELIEKLNCKYLVLTLGEHGMMLFEKSDGEIVYTKIDTRARKVADVSGAGDTVISTIAVCLAGGASVIDAVTISNYAAGIVVEEVGIVPIDKQKLIESIPENNV
ncbi:MAG: D-glycero-beta-D-manno-heptose-7-phosphate kinase [Ignavibacteriae bacterium]|nr:D-glycero-beta-D-manno-heptose-7-phosphate kinase [Ignavibacteriota bacterium]MCB9242673.1 D-glycero-beta-D-manno-heptose-7-phosphate kinase [Ignavibacteriales bacterium]